MSQKVSRKSAVSEEKEKRQTHSPVKEMKKKMAANAEKEKQAAEKASDKHPEKTVEKPTEKPAEKTEKPAEKAAEKAEKHDKNEKPDKSGDKKAEKLDKSVDKKSEKLDKSVDKKSEKQTKEEQKKPEPQPEKSKTESSKEDKSGKPEKPDTKKAEPSKAKQNGRDRVHNGVSDVTLGTNGTDDVLNGTPKDKVLKLKEDAPAATDRWLRSSHSPKPQEEKKPEATNKDKHLDSPKKSELEKVEEKDEDAAKSAKNQEVEVEVLLEVPDNEGEEAQDKERSKTDTNFSKSRVKVSPYRRSMRIADQTNTSLQANYTGNNTTMEMDITESSSFMEDAPLDDSSYLRGLRSIRGRSSYKPLKEITLKHLTANRSARSTASTSIPSPAADSHSRPTGTVVGRKRKPDSDEVELGVELTESTHVASKRLRVLDRLTEPFRRVATAQALPALARRNAEIVGINTDLPLAAPPHAPHTFDPEALKSLLTSAAEPVAVPLASDEKDNKRCVIM